MTTAMEVERDETASPGMVTVTLRGPVQKVVEALVHGFSVEDLQALRDAMQIEIERKR